MESPCSWRGRTLVCRLRIRPRAGRDGFADRVGDRLKVQVKAPPLEGRANKALVAFIARSCGVPRRAVRVVAGEQARDKLVEIDEPARLPDELVACLESATRV